MSNALRAMLVLLVLASCGGRDNSAPRNINNACSILAQRPHFARAFSRAERRWNVPVAVLMATIYQESKFISNAKTPHKYKLGVIPMGRQSSAYGYSQALDGTWDEYRRKTGKRGARRNNIHDSADFMGWYMNLSRERNGISLSDTRNQYLAYHEGHGGFRRGTYRSKSWLLRISRDVANRAVMYDAQLATCPRRLR